MTDRPFWRERPPPRDDRLAQLQRAGQQCVLALFSLLRTAAIHDLNNHALDRPVASLLEGLTPFVRRAHGRFSVVALEGQLYLDDIRVRLPGQSYHIIEELETLLAHRGVGGISFEGQPSTGELRRFAHAFQHASPSDGPDPLSTVRAALEAAEVGKIRVTRPVRAQLEGADSGGAGDGSARVDTTITYAKAVSALSQLLDDPSGHAQLRRRHISHVVREIADCASETLDYLIGLTDYSANRRDRARLCVDSCVVAIALARAMKLPRRLIADLGVATMMSTEQRSTEEGPPAVPARALTDLIKARRWTPSLLRRTLTVAQGGQSVRGSGGLPDQFPLARIHRVARDYIALTHGIAPTTYEERDKLTPLEALSFLGQSPSSVYDPLVISQLVRIVGLYPVGTLLRLDDGRQAFVVGRDDGQTILLIRTGPNRFGERVSLEDVGAEVIGVATGVDAGERAIAVLGDADQQAVRRAGEEVAEGSTLARVQLHRIAVKRPLESDP